MFGPFDGFFCMIIIDLDAFFIGDFIEGEDVIDLLLLGRVGFGFVVQEEVFGFIKIRGVKEYIGHLVHVTNGLADLSFL